MSDDKKPHVLPTTLGEPAKHDAKTDHGAPPPAKPAPEIVPEKPAKS